ncbi:major facilitator superfamily domain-containing protein [Diplogelasinospora grovesii]|uniref:Major facilitator superfamily domain-containing protein n=1 Tax=Diplogelasinospora grovesii TaxID=303347 RepID=A0AAN6S0J5_9PEZI|nr:major facilitator superfamily domain-containing protein [Diplogelasinospora grovesii]
MAGGVPIPTAQLAGGYLTGRALVFPLSLVICLFFLWGFSYGLLDVLNKHFQTVLGITKLESTGLQVVYFGGGYLLFSPIAAEVLKKRGYKLTILMGLCLYSIGAVMFWPTAKFASAANHRASFGGFCACTLVIACGLATLETAANSYAVVIGSPASASWRLQFCQSWNGVASFIGPLIAASFFFSGENANSLTNVQFVYLAVACAGVAVAVLFLFAKLPEVTEAMLAGTTSADQPALDEFGRELGAGPLYRQYNMVFAFVAQFCYVGAQVTIASFFINYVTENASFTSAEASNMLSYALISFTVGRFIATAIATVLQADFIMIVYSAICIALTAYASVGHGTPAVAVLITVFFFEAPMYPTIFAMGTANLGRHTRRAAGILVMGVSGGAVFPPIQGAIADAIGTRISYVVPLVGFVYVLGYVTFHWIRTGRHVLRVKEVVAVGADAAAEPSEKGAELSVEALEVRAGKD